MTTDSKKTLEERLQEVEDRLAIQQVVAGYGYAVDGRNPEAVGSFYTEDGVYAVGDIGAYEGRAAVAGITDIEPHMTYVAHGCAHMSTNPYIVLDGDRAAATCHTMVMLHGEDGFYAGRLSASRIELTRIEGSTWQIVHRQNYMLDGDQAAPALLARLQDGPSVTA